MKLSRELGVKESELFLLDDIGQYYFEQKNYPEAKRFFTEAIGERRKMKEPEKLANALMNAAIMYRRMNLYDSAGVLLEEVRQLAKASNDSLFLGNVSNALATHFFRGFTTANGFETERGDFSWDRELRHTALRDSAELHWNRALGFWKNEKHRVSRVNPVFNLGYLYQSKKQFDKALACYESAFRLLKELGLKGQEQVLFGNLGEVHYDMGRYREAADYFRKVVRLKDSLLKDEAKAYALKLERQYQLEGKNKTILEQELELSRKDALLHQQQKRIYVYVILLIVFAAGVAGVFAYLNFNRRLNRKLEQAKEKFFSNIMHEIRTPLSMIQAPLQTLKPRLQDEESRYYIGIAEKNILRLHELSSQMLDLSRLSHTQYTIKPSVGNASAVLQDICSGFRKAAREKNLGFVAEIELDQPVLMFDKDALEKIVTNLLSNAVKYTDARGIVGITVSGAEKETVYWLLVEVWDTGAGIAAEEQEKIFERFYRGKRNPSYSRGAGIGLSLVKEIVLAWKGRIRLLSEPGRGSRFSVELPLFIPVSGPASQAPQPSGDGEPRVLVVEDDADIRSYLETLLRSSGLEVITATNGLQARALLSQLSPDVILTDLMMEGMNGEEFIRWLKSDPGLDHIPVIVLSAKTQAATRVELAEAGAQVYLSKPFQPGELLAVINSTLRQVARWREELKEKVQGEAPQSVEERYSSKDPYLQKLFSLIFSQLDDSSLSVEKLADQMATNRSHFQRKVKTLSGHSPSELIRNLRLEKAREFLLAKKGNVTEVAYMCGFSSQSYFSKCYSAYFGVAPGRAANAG